MKGKFWSCILSSIDWTSTTISVMFEVINSMRNAKTDTPELYLITTLSEAIWLFGNSENVGNIGPLSVS
jgi:hypothetical protein